MTEVPYTYLLCRPEYFHFFFEYRYQFGGRFYGNADGYVVTTGLVESRPNLLLAWLGEQEGGAYIVEWDKYPIERVHDIL